MEFGFCVWVVRFRANITNGEGKPEYPSGPMPNTIWLTTCISSAVVYTLFEYVTSMQIRVRPKKKSSEVCMKSRSTPASLLFKGLVTEHTTLKWSTLTLQNSSIFDMNDLKEGNIRQYDKLSLCRKCWPSNQMQFLRRGKQRREQTNATKTRRPRPYALEVNQRHTGGTHALWPLHQSCFKKRNLRCNYKTSCLHHLLGIFFAKQELQQVCTRLKKKKDKHICD